MSARSALGALALLAAPVAAARSPGPEAPGCAAEDAAPDAFVVAVQAADLAIAALDTEALDAARARMEAALRCVPAPIDATQASSAHRVLGIAAFVGGDPAAAGAAFDAARRLDPTATLGHEIGGPLQAAWDRSLTRSTPEQRPLRAPLRGDLRVDGAPAESAPVYLPFVLQRVEGEAVAEGWWVGPGAPLPDYARRPEARDRAPALARASGASLAAAALCLGGAGAMRLHFNDPTTEWEDVERFVVPNRALGVSGVGLAAAGVGLGAAAIVAGKF